MVDCWASAVFKTFSEIYYCIVHTNVYGLHLSLSIIVSLSLSAVAKSDTIII